MRSSIIVLGAALSFTLLACGKRHAPPGASVEPSASARAADDFRRDGAASAAASGSGPSAQAAPNAPKPGSLDDNLPFASDGTRVASVAWRTWVYTDVGKQRTRYGYLRAGAIVDARGPAIQNDGCDGGWYRVNPRGFVCLGLGASLKLDDSVVVASGQRPVRGQSLPYLYALSKETAPLLYFKLASKAQMKEAEGMDVSERSVRFRELVATQGLDKLVALQDEPPDFLKDGKKLDKPYGVKQPMQKGVEAGPSSADSGFAIARTFIWEGRAWGLTTELDLVALDRVNIVKPSVFHGVELSESEDLPVAFVKDHYADRYGLDPRGQPLAKGSFGYREGMKLSGQSKPGGFLELRDGSWAAQVSLRILKARKSFPSVATGDRKWIDISIKEQTLVAYVGRRPVYATLISSGRGGLGKNTSGGSYIGEEPEKLSATVRGTFMIYQKEVSSTMDGDEDQSDSFNLRDVPFVQYFHKGFALHGTYWHDDFGKVRSHGCVNLAPIDAAWLFEWTDPSVPADWHGVVNKERGTVVYIHV